MFLYAVGHCIRLYGEDDLKRDNIEPEIVRASLDSVILQLVRLGYNPFLFEFMTMPARSALEDSLRLLTELYCIKRNPSKANTNEEYVVHEYGRLFSELPFDPRLSAFVVTCHLEFNKLELASVIAAILSAPGNIYFMGGGTKEAKEEARRRVSTRASRFDSDLLCMADVFSGWYSAGMTNDKGMCVHCNRKCPGSKGCRPCRVKYSNSEGLNNKVLDVVMNTSRSVKEIIGKARLSTTSVGKVKHDADDTQAVSECLERYFSEQLGEVLVPEHPPDGVRLDNVNVRARITNSSSFLQKVRENPFRSFVALSVTQIPSGEYIIDRLHPVCSEQHTCAPACTVIYHRDGIGHQVYRTFRSWLSQQMGRKQYYWSVCVYDSKAKTLQVFNTEEYGHACHDEIMETIESIIQDSISQSVTQLVSQGSFEASFVAGFTLKSVTPLKNTWRIQFVDLPIQSTTEFRSWLHSYFDEKVIPKRAVRWAGAFEFNGNDGRTSYNGAVVLSSESSAQRVIENGGQYIRQNEYGDRGDADTYLNKGSNTSRVVLRSADTNLTVSILKEKLKQFGVQAVTKLYHNAGRYVLYIRNLNVNFGQEWLLGLDFIKDKAIDVNIKKGVLGQPTHEAFLTFDNVYSRDSVLSELCNLFSQTTFVTTISYRNQKGVNKTKDVRPEPLVNMSKDNAPTTAYELIFNNGADADGFYTFHQAGNLPSIGISFPVQIDSRAEVNVKYPELHANIQDNIKKLGSRFSVRVNFKDSNKSTGRRDCKQKDNMLKVQLANALPSDVAKAVAAIRGITSTIVLCATTDKQKTFYNELSRSTRFKDEVSKLGLRVDWTKDRRGEIFGPRIAQGKMMRFIADCFDDFEKRYIIYTLPPRINSMFYKGKAGAAKFALLQESWKGRCHLRHRLFGSEIVVHFSEADENDLKELDSDITALLESIGGSGVSTSQECVYCTKETKSCSNFSICGHSYCTRCLSSAVSAEATCGVFCPFCNTKVHIKDIKDALSAEQFALVCSRALRATITAAKAQFDVRCCPNTRCSGLLPVTTALQTCSECSAKVCVSCDRANVSGHVGRTCEEFGIFEEKMKSLSHGMRDIINRGMQFVRDEWSADLPDVTGIAVNPGIVWNCDSFGRFEGALSKGRRLDDGFYAWHGTGESAIGPICDTGFSPKFRRGQAHGDGEYFGTHANVSLGYAQQSNRLILAYILNSSAVKTVENFCYVVNNPIDWSYSYCMPLLVVSFDRTIGEPQFILREQPILKSAGM